MYVSVCVCACVCVVCGEGREKWLCVHVSERKKERGPISWSFLYSSSMIFDLSFPFIAFNFLKFFYNVLIVASNGQKYRLQYSLSLLPPSIFLYTFTLSVKKKKKNIDHRHLAVDLLVKHPVWFHRFTPVSSSHRASRDQIGYRHLQPTQHPTIDGRCLHSE